MTRRWIHEALEATSFTVAGEAATVAEAVRLIERRAADVLLVDFKLGEATGVELLRRLRRRGLTTPALVTTASPTAGLNELVREAGAQGCFVKTGAPADLVEALERTLRGDRFFDPRNATRAVPKLTRRELDVLREVAQGHTNQEIADRLAVSVNTVKTLQARAGQKLGTHRRTATVVEARKLGLI